MLGFDFMESFPAATILQNIRIAGSTISNASIPALSETELHASTKRLGRRNEQFRDFIGTGYHNAVVPPVILRNVCHTLSATLALC
jgi:glycine dehydrogenase